MGSTNISMKLMTKASEIRFKTKTGSSRLPEKVPTAAAAA
jgi:hypothetical protein